MDRLSWPGNPTLKRFFNEYKKKERTSWNWNDALVEANKCRHAMQLSPCTLVQLKRKFIVMGIKCPLLKPRVLKRKKPRSHLDLPNSKKAECKEKESVNSDNNSFHFDQPECAKPDHEDSDPSTSSDSDLPNLNSSSSKPTHRRKKRGRRYRKWNDPVLFQTMWERRRPDVADALASTFHMRESQFCTMYHRFGAIDSDVADSKVGPLRCGNEALYRFINFF